MSSISIKRNKAKLKKENRNRSSPVAEMLHARMVSPREIPCSQIQLRKQIHQFNKRFPSPSSTQALCSASGIKTNKTKHTQEVTASCAQRSIVIDRDGSSVSCIKGMQTYDAKIVLGMVGKSKETHLNRKAVRENPGMM